MKKLKVALITNIIPPYRIPLFNWISKNGDFDFKVVALAEIEENREWRFAKEKIRFNHKILPGWHLFFYRKKREISFHFNLGAFNLLKGYNPDIVITSGYNSLAFWQAFLYCKIFRRKYILWNGTTLLSTGSIKGLRGVLKRIIIKGTDKYIAYGTKAKEYLEKFGANQKDIYISTNTVDVRGIQDKVLLYRNSKGFLEERKKYPKILFLYVGQLIKRKGVGQVLSALNILKDPEIGFMIVGSGPEKKNLENFCVRNRLQNVFFEGFHQPEELPKYYVLADIFILPSFKEVWGLVINESLASGLYVLCSKYAGAGYDLINGNNGKIFNPYNVNKIVDNIKEIKNKFLQLRANREKISSWSSENLTIAKSGDGFISAIESLR